LTTFDYDKIKLEKFKARFKIINPGNKMAGQAKRHNVPNNINYMLQVGAGL